jgi:hypothetical protein
LRASGRNIRRKGTPTSRSQPLNCSWLYARPSKRMGSLTL